MEYTLEQFATELRALLRKAVNAGHDVDDISDVAEAVLEAGWGTDEEDKP